MRACLAKKLLSQRRKSPQPHRASPRQSGETDANQALSESAEIVNVFMRVQLKNEQWVFDYFVQHSQGARRLTKTNPIGCQELLRRLI